MVRPSFYQKGRRRDTKAPTAPSPWSPRPGVVRVPAMKSKLALVGLGLLFVASAALYYREHDPKLSTATPSTPDVSSATETPAEEPAKLEAVIAPPSTPPSVLTSFDRAPDGSPLPELPADAPKRVKLGVALFAYEGAQGLGKKGRNREAALELARKALATHGADFAKVVAEGDPGSAADIGWVKRGILERRAESAVFRLRVGEALSEPVDTPRGYWVARRVE